jgi:hypothetical protein
MWKLSISANTWHYWLTQYSIPTRKSQFMHHGCPDIWHHSARTPEFKLKPRSNVSCLNHTANAGYICVHHFTAEQDLHINNLSFYLWGFSTAVMPIYKTQPRYRFLDTPKTFDFPSTIPERCRTANKGETSAAGCDWEEVSADTNRDR